MLSETKMRIYLCAAQTLNFTDASKKLFMTPQAVSKTVRELETELETQLFLRSTGKQLELTAEGIALMDCFSNFLNEYDGIKKRLSASSRQHYEIRMGVPPYEISSAYTNALSKTRQLNAQRNITVQIKMYDQLFYMLSNGMLDVVQEYLPRSELYLQKKYPNLEKEIKTIKLLNLQERLLVSSANPKATDRATYLDFKEEPLICQSSAGEAPRETIAKAKAAAKKNGLTPSDFIIKNDRDSIYSAVELGQGVTIAARSVSLAVRTGSIKWYPLNNQLTFCFFYRKSLDKTSQNWLKIFAENLQEELLLYEK
ncbi:MAG: LysR family transcriptional regulator [Lachnospiraceae bacterium]|nr:LysR family transcriptional regulator [Lachnospiraceae bacterium]